MSSQDWEGDLWTNKQHIASRLAKAGANVLYVKKSQDSLGDFLKKPSQKISENLTVAHSFRMPFKQYAEFGLKLDLVRRFRPDIVWIYHPGYGHYLDKLPKNAFVLYDCVDDYASFPEYRDSDWICQGEAKILARANLVITSAHNLFLAKKDKNPNVHYVHNVGDFDHFHQAVSHVKNTPPRIGFYGAISNYKVDLDLILDLAKRRSDWQLYLIGPVGLSDDSTSVDQLKQQPNVKFLGQIDYKKLPGVLSQMDVLIIPYRLTDHTQNVFPIKFFECLATGKPVVITPLPALRDYFGVVETAQNANEFIEKIDRVMHSDNPEPRIALARKNDWQSRIDRIVALIKQSQQRRTIGIDGRPLQDASKNRGIGVYLRELLNTYKQIKPDLDIRLVFDKQLALPPEDFSWFKPIVCGRKKMDRQGLDFIHFPGQYCVPKNVKTPHLITVHDLIPFVMKDMYYQGNERLYQKDLGHYRRILYRAQKLVAVSQTTADDIKRFFPGTTPIVIYNGLNTQIYKTQPETQPPYVLYVGGFDQRKNVLNAIQAADLANVQLVIVGKKEKEYLKKIDQTIQKCRNPKLIVLTDYVNESELRDLYSGAQCLVFPSYYEGFGFPPLEALKCGIPVVAGNNSSQSELLQGYATLVDPSNVFDIKDAILTALGRNGFDSQKAMAYAQQFSWDRAAHQTLALYS